jgi:flagellar biosynthesis/type III secretory pathway protein FliH
MPSGFVPLESFFQLHPNETARDEVEVQASPSHAGGGDEAACKDERTVDALAAARRFHAALADALDAALDALVRKIAREVLGRDLALAPVDIAAIASSVLYRYAAESPVCLRAHPDQINQLAGLGLGVVADPKLGRGDIIVELRSGTIDARLAARLECVLESATVG